MDEAEKTTEAVARTLKEFILAELLPDEDPNGLDVSTQLITGGILDSLAVLTLVGFLDDHYGIELEAYEIGDEYLDSISQIADLVSARLSGS